MSEVVRMLVEKREASGTGVARALRRESRVPAIMYGGVAKEVRMSLGQKELMKEVMRGNFKSKIVELQCGTEVYMTVPKEIQFHPVSDLPLHVDFRQIDENTIVKVGVTVHVINQELSPGVKLGGIVTLAHREIMLLCHPRNIPSMIDVDIAGMNIGDNLHINDIKLPEGVKPVDRDNFSILSISGATKEVEAQSAAEAAAATPTATA